MGNYFEVGDIVGRKSHNNDILFKISEIINEKQGEKAILRGVDVRLFADSYIDDLEKKSPSQISKCRQEFIKKNSDCLRRIFERRVEDKTKLFLRGANIKNVLRADKIDHFEVPGTVLHLDGDKEYMELCKTTYAQLNIKAYGYEVSEENQVEVVEKYLKKHNPNILILTGHDGLIKKNTDIKDVKNYRNSNFFIEAVRKARAYEPGRDDLIIFAGACQSHYEALLEAGANFASSPQRVLIHAFDPVFIAEKLAYSSIYEKLNVEDVINNTITGMDAVGGIETRGCLRLGYPKSSY
ncbi:MAG: sporulation peptidase YabG [Clostridia bacterium]|nr:sporulation peptidase YabG [Clostridia bacterium]MDD4047736.1 sporulation peptidase YabG [Clostridia bacterium]